MTQDIALLPHQIEDAAFLSSRKFAGCFSGMGSGKTLTALEAVRLVKTEDGPCTLIVAPPIALRMWASEFERHVGGTAQIIRSGKTKIDPLALAVITTYQIATTRKEEFARAGFDILICDESHALKSVTAKRTKAILGKGGLCESVKHAWLLTGTPVTRWNDDLFPFLCRAGADLLKKSIGGLAMERFQLRYCITQKRTFPGAKYPTTLVVGNRNTEELNEMLFKGGLAVRRELAEVWAAMPSLTTSRLYVDLELTPELREMLAALEKQTVAQIEEGLARKEEGLSTLRRKLGLSKVKHSVQELAERVQAGNRPILVGAWHTDVIDALRDGLEAEKCIVGVIDGRTSATGKAQMEDAFNAGALDILVCQIAAAGVSLNLQKGGAHQIVVVEEDWSPAVMDQFFARLHRMGQKHSVHVDVFQSDTKLDKALIRISNAKRAGQRVLLDQEGGEAA